MTGVEIGLFASLSFTGWVVSLLFVPMLADLYGRKWIIVWFVLLRTIVYQCICITTNMYFGYALFFLSGFSLAGTNGVAYVYLMELLPQYTRPIIGASLNAV